MYFVLKILKILFTLFRSTCCGHHCVHHQELLSCTCSLWSRVVLGSLCPPVLLCCNCCFFVFLWVGMYEDERNVIFRNAVSYTLNDGASLFRRVES